MFPALKNKTFRSLSENKTYQVIDQFEDIAILDGNQRISIKRLLDCNYFDEVIDPKVFFNNEKSYNSFVEKIKSIPLDKINDSQRESDNMVIEYDPDEEIKALEQKARKMLMDNNPYKQVEQQVEKLREYIDEDDDIQIPLPKTVESPKEQESNEIVQRVEVNRNPSPKKVEVKDPIIEMFKNVKRNTPFKISIDVENKIPRKDFIEMMEDSYETSIIDYLSEEFTNEILKNPDFLKEKIKEGIKNIVYPKKEKPTPRPRARKGKIENKDSI